VRTGLCQAQSGRLRGRAPSGLKLHHSCLPVSRRGGGAADRRDWIASWFVGMVDRPACSSIEPGAGGGFPPPGFTSSGADQIAWIAQESPAQGADASGAQRWNPSHGWPLRQVLGASRQ